MQYVQFSAFNCFNFGSDVHVVLYYRICLLLACNSLELEYLARDKINK